MAQKEHEKFIDSCVLEGMVSISALISTHEQNPQINDRVIKKVYFDSEKIKSKARELNYLKRKSEREKFEICFCDADEIESYVIGNSHGGIIAVCENRTFPELAADKIRLSEKVRRGFFVMIEGVEDPYNFGYAVRSIYAAGADGIILSPRNWMSAAGIVCRASAGASERIPVYISTPEETAKIFHNEGYRVVSADIKNSVPISEACLDFPLLLIIGGEKRGISKELLETSDEIVRLEYGREFEAALSTASAASIIAFEILRRNT